MGLAHWVSTQRRGTCHSNRSMLWRGRVSLEAFCATVEDRAKKATDESTLKKSEAVLTIGRGSRSRHKHMRRKTRSSSGSAASTTPASAGRAPPTVPELTTSAAPIYGKRKGSKGTPGKPRGRATALPTEARRSVPEGTAVVDPCQQALGFYHREISQWKTAYCLRPEVRNHLYGRLGMVSGEWGYRLEQPSLPTCACTFQRSTVVPSDGPQRRALLTEITQLLTKRATVPVYPPSYG